MAQKFHTDPQYLGAGYPIIAADSTQLSEADAVYIDTSGFLAISSTTNKILGFSLDTIDALTSDNSTVAKVKPKYTPGQGIRVQYPSDIDCTQTDIGAYADLSSGTTNAQTINLLAGGTGQFLVLGFDPEDEADDDVVVVEVAEPQQLAFAQS